MELDAKLKQDTNGDAFAGADGDSSFMESDECADVKEEATVKEYQVPFLEEAPQVCVPDANETAALLGAICRQLSSLGRDIADLKTEARNCMKSGYGGILQNVEAARCSIESAVAGVKTTSTEFHDKITGLFAAVGVVSEKQDRNDRQLAQALRENANFQIQVRQGMQRDIDALKEAQSGEQFNPILKEIASVYAEYQGLLEDEGITGQSKKNLKAMFEQIEDLLGEYGAEILKSAEGSARQTRSAKVIGKMQTHDPDRHNTVARSRRPGVVRGRTVLHQEFVDVFVFDPAAPHEAEESKMGFAAESNAGD